MRKLIQFAAKLKKEKPPVFYSLVMLAAFIVLALAVLIIRESVYSLKVEKTISLLKSGNYTEAEKIISRLPERSEKYILSIYLYIKESSQEVSSERVSQAVHRLSQMKIHPYILKKFLTEFSGSDFDSVMFRGLLMDSVNPKKLSRKEKIEVFEIVKDRTGTGYRAEERVYATDLIGRLEIPQAVPLLEKLVQDPGTPWGVKFVAEDHLKRLRNMKL